MESHVVYMYTMLRTLVMAISLQRSLDKNSFAGIPPFHRLSEEHLDVIFNICNAADTELFDKYIRNVR